MPGYPQLREVGLLCAPDGRLLAMVRLEERMDGTGWDVYLNDPAPSRTQHVRIGDEPEARAELARIYATGRTDGEWQIRRPHNPYDGPTDSRTPPAVP